MTDRIVIILNSLLYILNKFEGRKTDSHQLFKILYFAEQKHLSIYGKSITSDKYVAMKFGPVPSSGFDIVNCTKGNGDSYSNSINQASNFLIVEGFNITALAEADLEWLSETEIFCLDESYNENKDLDFTQLTNKSHDSAWDKAIHYMDKVKIAEAGGADENVIKYLSSKEELKNISF